MRELALAALLAGSAARAGVSVPPEARGNALFDQANAAYLSGETSRAVSGYEALLEEGLVSPELETNLGAAYLRQGKRGLAALHLERALFLDPSDDDARADLLEVRRGIVDKLEGEAENGGVEVLSRALAPLPGRAAAVALVALWSLGWGLLGANLIRPRAALGTFAIACFLLAGAAALVAAGSAAAHQLTLRRAVVVAQAAPAREGPSDRAASHFEVHEGTALRIEDEDQGFRRVKLANGLTGWVHAAAVEPVVPSGWSNQHRPYAPAGPDGR
jgi:tetratricopeptide (TPR) repeat protein